MILHLKFRSVTVARHSPPHLTFPIVRPSVRLIAFSLLQTAVCRTYTDRVGLCQYEDL